MDIFRKTEKYPRDSDRATNMMEKVIKCITLDNQLISVVEDQSFLHHLEFLNPWYVLPSLHYITFIPLSSYGVLYVRYFCGSHTAEHVKPTFQEMLNAMK